MKKTLQSIVLGAGLALTPAATEAAYNGPHQLHYQIPLRENYVGVSAANSEQSAEIAGLITAAVAGVGLLIGLYTRVEDDLKELKSKRR